MFRNARSQESQDLSEDFKSEASAFWEYFYKDQFAPALNLTQELAKKFKKQPEKDFITNMAAKVLLRKGLFKEATKKLSELEGYSALKFLTRFLVEGKPEETIKEFQDDVESRLYKTQCVLLSKIYWGPDFTIALDNYEDPDKVLEEAFQDLIEQQEYDKAIIAAIQAIELFLEDNILSHDLQLPLIHKQIDRLIMLASKAKYSSTKAKLFLLKAKLFSDRESAEDAEILFGKEKNENGLAEVYLLYAKEFEEKEYFAKSIKLFEKNNNQIALGYTYQTLASNSLNSGEIHAANNYFKKAFNCLQSCGIFEELGLEIQRISLMAIKGDYQKVKESIHEMIKPNIPSFYIAQSYHILANTLVQTGEDIESAKRYIETSCNLFRKLKRYNQLLFTQNIYFQILLIENDLKKIEKLGKEIIQLAGRIGNDEIKVSKYLDLAFVTVRISLEEGTLNEEKLENVNDYFKKAIKFYQEKGNVTGEADIYQSIANMYTSIGKLEEALKAYLTAKKLYQKESAHLQSAITDTLIGILLLNYVVINEQTYDLAEKHFEHALVYFSKENLLDLLWKVTYYLADLNYKYYLITNKEQELYKNKARKYFMEMHCAVQDFEQQYNKDSKLGSLVGVTIDESYAKAFKFFKSIGDDDTAEMFNKE